MNNRAYFFIFIAGIAIAAIALKQEDHQPTAQQMQKQIVEIDAAQEISAPKNFMALPTMAGNYLAARFAVSNDDLSSASKFYDLAIDNSITDAEKEFLYERTLPAAVGAGDIQSALEISKNMDLKKSTATAQLAVLTQIVEGFKQDDAETIHKLLPQLRTDGFGRLLKPLLEAWAYASDKKFDLAEQTLQQLKKEYPSLQPLVQMHMAFLYDFQDKKQPAELYYTSALTDNLSVRSAYIIAQFYERQEKISDVISLYEKLAAKMPGSPLPYVVLNRINKGDLHKEAFIQKPRDGVAATLYDVATVLHQEGSSRLAILYAQMAHYLSPHDEFTSLLIGDILSTTTVTTQAEEFLESVPKNSDLYVLGQMRLVQLYEQAGETEKSIKILESFKSDPILKQQALTELADLYRRQEEFAKAIPYYNEVLASKTKLTEMDWVLLYSRGICYERNNQWEKAEADLNAALKLSPQQPEILNYLAYSWADHGKNLPQALDMLQKALEGAPNDPYITDSVGWVLYKNNQAEEAVPYLEAAIQELPEDPVINDHLGDIYWSVGRKLEAGFQWQRALKNTKKTDDKAREILKEKLKNGLSADNNIVSSK